MEKHISTSQRGKMGVAKYSYSKDEHYNSAYPIGFNYFLGVVDVDRYCHHQNANQGGINEPEVIRINGHKHYEI